MSDNTARMREFLKSQTEARRQAEVLNVANRIVVLPIVGYHGGATADSTYERMLDSKDLFRMVEESFAGGITPTENFKLEGAFAEVDSVAIVEEAANLECGRTLGRLGTIRQNFENETIDRNEALGQIKSIIMPYDLSDRFGDVIGDPTYSVISSFVVGMQGQNGVMDPNIEIFIARKPPVIENGSVSDGSKLAEPAREEM